MLLVVGCDTLAKRPAQAPVVGAFDLATLGKLSLS